MQTVYILYECQEGDYDNNCVICVYTTRKEALAAMYTLYYESNRWFRLEETILNEHNTVIQIASTEELDWLTSRHHEREFLKDVAKEISDCGESKTLENLKKFANEFKQYHLVRETEFDRLWGLGQIQCDGGLSVHVS